MAACSSPGGVGNGGQGGAAHVVGTSGATVSLAGVTLDVPANAVSADTPITVASTTAPSGYAPVSAVYQFGPAGTTFAQPVAVTIPLTAATPDAHLFWSNAAGGFDDLGGTVTGTTLTGYVTHFSIGFCAKPSRDGGSTDAPMGGTAGTGGQGTGGQVGTGAGGASGGASGGGGGTAGTGGTGGTTGGAGATGSGGGGTAGTGATGGTTGGAGATGSGGVAGTTGSGGSGGGSTGGAGGTAGISGGAGTGGSADGGTDAGTALCAQIPLNLPFAQVGASDAGAAPVGSSYTGGTIPTGQYYLRVVTVYGGAGYTGATQVEYKIDATAQTIQIAERDPGLNSAPAYIGMTYTYLDAHTLQATVVCNSSSSTPASQYDYSWIVGNPSKLTMTAVGSSNVLTIF
jgi:hypothetical protein